MKIEIYRTYRRSKPYEQANVFNSYEYRWRMRAHNGRVVSQSSEGYLEPRNLVRGLEIAHPGCRLSSVPYDSGFCLFWFDHYSARHELPVTVPEGTADLWKARRKP